MNISDECVKGGYYSNSPLHVNANKVLIDSLVGSNEDVFLSAENVTNQEEGMIFTSNGNININAKSFKYYGVIYAPEGNIYINTENFVFKGVIIANNIKINTNRLELSCDKNVLNNYSIELYNPNESDIFEGDIFDNTAGGNGAGKYYYDTGTKCCTKVKYNKYNLLKSVKAGDIVYEANGGRGVTGHIAYVYGIYYMPEPGNYKNPKMYYNIRLIEAIPSNDKAIQSGVRYGILDDTRCDDKKVTILRYKKLSAAERKDIEYFLRKQINKPYKCDVKKDTSINEKDWYCSELVWAAYKYAGINIETSGKVNEPGVTPRDINRCSKLSVVDYK